MHVSGHASQEELKLVYSLVQPKYFLPVHGEFRHLQAHANLIKEMGHKEENVIIMQNGNVLELDSQKAEVTGYIDVDPVLVDGLGVGDVGNIVLRDRRHLSQDGLIAIVTSIDFRERDIISGPDVVSRGFVYVKESEELILRLKEIVMNVVESTSDKKRTDISQMKNAMRERLRSYIYMITQRRPIIIPVIMVPDKNDIFPAFTVDDFYSEN